MSTKLKLYNVTDEYIEYLMKIDKKVFSNKKEDRSKERKYLGIILKIGEFNYFVPLSSPKDTDYKTDKSGNFILDEDGKKQIRKSVVPIMRIVVKNVNGDDELKGTLKFSNMIPIPDCALVNYDVEKESDENYKILVTKELSFIFPRTEKIIKNAKLIYNQKINSLKKTNNSNKIKYLHNTINFPSLEKGCKKYEITKQSISVKEIVTESSETKS